jgi:predicted nucleic acid-binding protein
LNPTRKTVLVDTSGVFALSDRRSKSHHAVAAVFDNPAYNFVLPAPVLPEVCYLIATRLGHGAMRSFTAQLVATSPPIENLTASDYRVIAQILEQYADLKLDFVDAAIVVFAHRLQVQTLLTLDHRDFRAVKPKHTDYFDLLP